MSLMNTPSLRMFELSDCKVGNNKVFNQGLKFYIEIFIDLVHSSLYFTEL